jgi:GNAT superfamily N-acetyltransferase
MTSSLSIGESARFGLRVGRLTANGADIAGVLTCLRDDELDVLIVRAPADQLGLSAALSAIPGYFSIHADTLVYWRCDSLIATTSVATTCSIVDAERDALDALVGEVFAHYRNHYLANPLFGADQALDGYREWAALLFDQGATAMVLRSDDDRDLGFALIDWTIDPPDVRLAGLVPSARGGGLYRHLVMHILARVRATGHSAIQISTQAHNTRVMRVWAATGFQPTHSTNTYHLVKAELLEAALNSSPTQ